MHLLPSTIHSMYFEVPGDEYFLAVWRRYALALKQAAEFSSLLLVTHPPASPCGIAKRHRTYGWLRRPLQTCDCRFCSALSTALSNIHFNEREKHAKRVGELMLTLSFVCAGRRATSAPDAGMPRLYLPQCSGSLHTTSDDYRSLVGSFSMITLCALMHASLLFVDHSSAGEYLHATNDIPLPRPIRLTN